jgi:hypothetical protein
MSFLDVILPWRWGKARENKWKEIANAAPVELSEDLEVEGRAEAEATVLEQSAWQKMKVEDKIIRDLGKLQAKKYTLVKLAMGRAKLIAKVSNAGLGLMSSLSVKAVRIGQLAHVNVQGAAGKVKLGAVGALIKTLGVSMKETTEGREIQGTLQEGLGAATEKEKAELRKVALAYSAAKKQIAGEIQKMINANSAEAAALAKAITAVKEQRDQVESYLTHLEEEEEMLGRAKADIDRAISAENAEIDILMKDAA